MRTGVLTKPCPALNFVVSTLSHSALDYLSAESPLRSRFETILRTLQVTTLLAEEATNLLTESFRRGGAHLDRTLARSRRTAESDASRLWDGRFRRRETGDVSTRTYPPRNVIKKEFVLANGQSARVPERPVR